ncbi:GspH/FimT family pseudopilin [Aquitalea sp. ASV15]|uniref:GspH/FimT family pseudopilin n=1 Tax=Aquitalea sp. ASV15 TaxID=2795104 RepID=UPI0018ED3061|nr:GspH/FimT family pseudopilin [Aquitalea sp. ASV15]
MARFRSANGFTLIEVIVVLAVASILLAIAAPSMSSFVRSNRISSAANDLQQTFLAARSNAVRTGVPVVVCASSSSSSGCDASSFNSGWVVFADLNRNNTLVTGTSVNFGNAIASGTTDLVVLRKMDINSTLRLSVSNASAVTSFRYLPTGRVQMYNGSWTSANSIMVCDDSANAAISKKLTFSSAGRPMPAALSSGESCP